MFCPEGFVPAEDLLHRLSALAAAELSYGRLFEFHGITNGSSFSGKLIADLSFAAGIFPHWAFWRLLSWGVMQPYICSPDGMVLKAGSSIVLSTDELTFDFHFPVVDGSQLDALMSDLAERNRSGEIFIWFDPGLFINSETFCVVDPQEARRRVERYVEFREGADFRTDLKYGYPSGRDRLVMAYNAFDHERDLRVAMNFAHWSLCFKSDDVAVSDETLIQSLDLSPFFEVEDGPSFAADGSEPKDIIAKIVQLHDTGEPVIRDAVRRKFARGMKEEQWRATWKAAAELRPELSRRGPKRLRGPRL